MNIGEAARQSGVSAKMIRYYEGIGLIKVAKRKGSGAYRIYTEADVHVLQFIRRSRDLGFTVAEITNLLRLWQDRRRASADVKFLVTTKIADLDTRIAELQSMKRTLEHLATNCNGDHRPDCPILDDLAGGGPCCHGTQR
ncbi:MAG TPA: Cu(I)-responsive transcriptional regulator [Rhabdaerophilum sp.]|nr:Cu(I)-responsive transcriptional regulator [Rhabdaerophilum sp.]